MGFLHWLGDSPRCSQTYHNRSHGAPIPVIRDPSYSEGRPECPPWVWFSPEIDTSNFTLRLLSHTPGGSQWLKYILLMWDESWIADQLYIQRGWLALQDFLFFSLYSLSCTAKQVTTLESPLMWILSRFTRTGFQVSGLVLWYQITFTNISYARSHPLHLVCWDMTWDIVWDATKKIRAAKTGDSDNWLMALARPGHDHHQQKAILASENGPHQLILLHILYRQSEQCICNLPPWFEKLNHVITSSRHVKNLYRHFSWCNAPYCFEVGRLDFNYSNGFLNCSIDFTNILNYLVP